MVKLHDEKTKDFEAAKATARAAIEAHYLLTIVDQVKEIADKIAAFKAEADLLTNGGLSLPDQRSLAQLLQWGKIDGPPETVSWSKRSAF